jgi:quaternary ammonium compound-resistance protein SugE
MSWTLVVIAGFVEIAFAISLKYSEGFARLLPTGLAFAFGGLSFALLTFGMKNLSAGTAYAVWTGIGAAGTVTIGMIFLHDSTSPGRVIAIAMVIFGIIGLKLAE